jgi:hypothetical protein
MLPLLDSVLFLNHPPGTFAGPGVRLSALAAHGQAASVPDAAIATEIH